MILEDATGKRDAWKKSRGSRLATRSRRSGSINGVSNCIILRAADPSTGAVALISHSLSRSQNVGSPSRCLKNRNRPCTLLSMMAGVVRRVSITIALGFVTLYTYVPVHVYCAYVSIDGRSTYARDHGGSPRELRAFFCFFFLFLFLFSREKIKEGKHADCLPRKTREKHTVDPGKLQGTRLQTPVVDVFSRRETGPGFLTLLSLSFSFFHPNS